MNHTNTRQHANLHQPSVNVTKKHKGVYCLGVKVFNMLLPYINDNPKKVKVILQKLLHENSFYFWWNILKIKKVKYSRIN